MLYRDMIMMKDNTKLILKINIDITYKWEVY